MRVPKPRSWLAIFIFFLGLSQASHALPRRGNVSPESKFCIESTEAFLKALEPRPANELLKDEVRGVDVAAGRWMERTLMSEVQSALDQSLNWAIYSEELKTKGSQHVFWLQQQRLKELNESLWNIGGTERYLTILDEEIANVLKEHSSYGQLMHRNYKDRVIVSTLSEEEFKTKVLRPVEERVSARISATYGDQKSQPFWRRWIEQTLDFGFGTDAVEAHLNLKLEGKDFGAWRTRTIALRESLEKGFKAHQLSWDEALKVAKEAKGDELALARWFKSSGDPAASPADLVALSTQFKHYLDALQVADFLPFAPGAGKDQIAEILALQIALHQNPELLASKMSEVQRLTQGNWILERGLFLAETTHAGHIVATDIRGLGLKSMKARDAWVLRGAKPEELPLVYEQTTRELETRYGEILKSLKGILGENAKVDYFRSGDDALWSLPPMSAEKLKQVRAYFAAQADLYSHVEDVEKVGDGEAVSDAIVRARDALFGGKGKAPAKDRDGLPEGYHRVPSAARPSGGAHREPSSEGPATPLVFEIQPIVEGAVASQPAQQESETKKQGGDGTGPRTRTRRGPASISPVFGF